ncbi:MAG: T9SS type A sorting domain-containing protein [Bacteroidia bacterium]|nr:T9SS type A sorting domain-containing protein [Bacteroidia bacterium]
MRTRLLITLIIFSFIGYSQNWNVFNPNYRYNYKFDNSAVVTNVIFAQSSGANASQTVCITNTIGVVNGGTLSLDQPQFLMRNINSMSNGTVILTDPSTITIVPKSSVGQSWVFDQGNNFTATCVSTSTQSIFNVMDSVRTIIVNNVDSIILSKQFGILQFPKLYAQNKYYRLAGIEDNATYTLTALFGEKVPNAWDIYNYYIGFKWCVLTEFSPTGSGSNVNCSYAVRTVKSKTVTANSYVYTVDGVYTNSPGPIISGYCASSTAPSTVINNTNLVIDGSPASGPLGLSSPSLTENTYYPGFAIQQGYPPYSHSIVRLGKDNTGRIYKYHGAPCFNTSLGVGLPNQNEPAGYGPSGPISPPICGINQTWGVGLGKVSELSGYCVSGYQTYCTTCFGAVGLHDLKKDEENKLLVPNPANSLLSLPIDYGNVKFFDPLGKLVKSVNLNGKKVIDVSELPNGLYFVEIQTDSFKSSQKLIIQH